MSETKTKPGFCWCWMCGYTASVKAEDREKVSDDAQAECPDCKDNDMMSFLNSGDEMDPDIDPDEPMPEWPKQFGED